MGSSRLLHITLTALMRVEIDRPCFQPLVLLLLELEADLTSIELRTKETATVLRSVADSS
jgi:hypothetical protein